jgi:hypothetical protein
MSVETVSPQEPQSSVAFIGSGLVFAGITNTCGMVLVLARMPSNQRPRIAVSDLPGAACPT